MWAQNREAAKRTAERRQREADAPRLSALVPALEKLRIEVLERSSSISRPEHTHVRHIVVASAPALFVMPCHDTQCKDGGHDLTTEILSALRGQKVNFQGEDVCSGVVGSAGCSRVLGYVAVATYREHGPAGS
jgi:hypothetical protein